MKKKDTHLCENCPNCGHWRKKESGKNKFLEVLLIIVALVLVIGYYKVYNI